jgi:hypothetical protein
MYRVEFDSESVRVFREQDLLVRAHWADIEQIGYRTTSAGPWFDDHFIVFKTRDISCPRLDISTDWEGALALSEHIKNLPGTKLPSEGVLANCTTERSTTVWPAEKSGKPIVPADEYPPQTRGSRLLRGLLRLKRRAS